jgi:hypothetical protein
MSYTKVAMDDERLADLCRDYPEITFAAASHVRHLLAEAEDRGRAYAASQLVEEMAAERKKGADESDRKHLRSVWAVEALVRAARETASAYSQYWNDRDAEKAK